VLELRAQRGRVPHAICLTELQPTGAGARVQVEHHLGRAGEILDRLLEIVDRAVGQARGIHAQVHGGGQRIRRRGAVLGRRARSLDLLLRG
jgi:hypothetical protein